jgi:hypothetical protein
MLKVPGADQLPTTLAELKEVSKAIKDDTRLPRQLDEAKKEVESLRAAAQTSAQVLQEANRRMERATTQSVAESAAANERLQQLQVELAAARAQLERYHLDAGEFNLHARESHILGADEVVVGLASIGPESDRVVINNNTKQLEAGGTETVEVGDKAFAIIVQGIEWLKSPETVTFRFLVRPRTKPVATAPATRPGG